MSDDVLSILESYHWPGNIRELQHSIEHAFVVCQGELITTDHLAEELVSQARATATQSYELSPDEERDALIAALKQAGGNKTVAAKSLGMSRRTIYRKLEEHGL